MRAWALGVLPLLGCPGGPPYPNTIGGEAFLYNAGEEDAQVELLPVIGRIDCAVVDHPQTAAALEHFTPDTEPLVLPPGEAWPAFQDALDNRQEWLPCFVGRVRVDEVVATMVFDLNLGWHEVVVPTAPSDLSHNTLLLETGPDGPSFRAGPQQDSLTVGPSTYPTCDGPLPSWTATSTSDATVLALTTDGTCTTIALVDQHLQICDAPHPPYQVGEDLDVEAGASHLSIRTSSGGKPYLLGTSAGALPSWLAVDVLREDDFSTPDIRLPACDVPNTCGPTLPVDPIISDGNPYRYAPWGESSQVVDPTGSARLFTVHAAGAPVDRTCPLALSFSLVPAVGSF